MCVFQMYQVNVRVSGRTHIVDKRYREFHSMHKQVGWIHEISDVLTLPSAYRERLRSKIRLHPQNPHVWYIFTLYCIDL